MTNPHPPLTTNLDRQIGRLTLGTGVRHNALSQAGWLAIPKAIDQLVADGARVIILSGQGESFCAGADISEFDTVRRDAETARIYEQSNADAFAAVRHAPVPVLAQISGYCLGGGFGLAAATDIRIAADNALFSVPAAHLGLAYPVEAMADIVHGLGAQNARHLLFTGQQHDAHAMKEMGFLAQVCAPDQLARVVTEMAEQIASLAPLTHRATKAAVRAALSGNEADLTRAKTLGDDTFESEDYAEGRKAFGDKRKPVFKDK